MSEDKSFKLIVALKFTQEVQQGLRCSIIIGDKIKESSLPLQEGQFFDLSQVPHQVCIKFYNNKRLQLGQLEIDVPNIVHHQEETEIAQQFDLEYEENREIQSIQGSYYIIVLNKWIFSSKNQQSKKVKFVDDASKKRIKTQPALKKPTKEAKNINSSNQNLKKTNLTTMSVKEKINEVVKNNLKIIKLHDTSCLSENERDSCQILDQLRSHLEPLSQETTPRDKNEDDGNNTTPTKGLSKKCVKKTVSSQSLSPMIKQEPQTKTLNQQTQNDYLKYAVWSLDRQVQQHNCNAKVNSALKEQLIASDNLQEENNQKLREFQDNYDLHIQNQADQIADILENQSKLRQVIEDKSALALKYEIECAQSQLMIKHKDLELFEFYKKNEDLKNLEQRLNHQESTITSLSQFNQQLKNDILSSNQKRNDEITQMRSELDRVSQDKWEIRQQHSEIQFELQRAKTLIEQQEFQLLAHDRSFQSTIVPQEGQVQAFMDEQQIHLKQIADLRYQNQGLVQALDSLKQQNSKQNNKRIEEERFQCDSQEQLKRKLLERENHVGSLNQFIEQIRLQNQNLKIQFQKLQQYEYQNIDFTQENGRIKKKLQIVVEANDQLNNHLEEAHAVNRQLQEEKLQIISRFSEAENQMIEKDSLLSNMKQAIIHQREKGGQYIPYPNDQIDRKVAEILLDQDERLKYILIREHEGVYSFGTRRLFIKIEQDKLLVRTGGGFVKMELFFDSATIEAEIDRVDRMTDHSIHMQKKKSSKKFQSTTQSQPTMRNILQTKN